MNELIAGVRSDVAVKVFGDDLDAAARDGRRDREGAREDPRRSRRQGRAGDRPADARARDRSRRARALRALAGRSAGGPAHRDRRLRRRPDLRGRPALRRRRAHARGAARRTRRRSSGCRSCSPSTSAEATRRAPDSPRSFRSAPSRSSEAWAPARIRSAARTESAASSSPPTCAAATSARSSRKPSSASARRSSFPAGYWSDVGRPVRAARVGEPPAPGHRAARAALDLRNPHRRVRLRPPRGDRLQRRSARVDGRDRLAARARDPALDLGRRRLHRALGRRSPERRRDDLVRERAAGAKGVRSTPRCARARSRACARS